MYSSNDKNPIWSQLDNHRDEITQKSISELFKENPNRESDFSTSFENLWIDVSKQLIDSKTFSLFSDLIEESKIKNSLSDMMSGSPVNSTEEKPALHTALRASRNSKILVDGVDVIPEITETLEKMEEFSHSVRDGKLLGATNSPIKSVVAVGIGGSHLGLSMACKALSELSHPELTIKFCSSIDPIELTQSLSGLDPETTIFVVTSKSFSTKETLSLMENAKDWLNNSIGMKELSKHIVGVTNNKAKAIDLGLEESMVFEIPDWVGGRFSLSSAAGLVLMISIGPEKFFQLLSGMNKIDEKTLSEPFESNGVLILSLIDIWNRSFLNHPTMAIVPYSSQMSDFPFYLQQLMMESLGKSNLADGQETKGPIGSVVWGATGTESQHAFFQFLHQGTDVVPCEMISFSKVNDNTFQEQKNTLFANLIAQTEALAFGSVNKEKGSKGRTDLKGNRPSTVILAPELSPYILGQLIALYEHRTVASGMIWGINPFDQWGVEFGKNLAVEIELELNKKSSSKMNSFLSKNLLQKFEEFKDF